MFWGRLGVGRSAKGLVWGGYCTRYARFLGKTSGMHQQESMQTGETHSAMDELYKQERLGSWGKPNYQS